MIFLVILGCSMRTSYYSPSSHITAVAPGASEGQFFISSNVMCGDEFLTSRITLCTYNDKDRETICANVADSNSIDSKVGRNGKMKFKVETSKLVCEKSFYKLDVGESGWTPTENTYIQ